MKRIKLEGGQVKESFFEEQKIKKDLLQLVEKKFSNSISQTGSVEVGEF
jgi:hypothetical protein